MHLVCSCSFSIHPFQSTFLFYYGYFPIVHFGIFAQGLDDEKMKAAAIDIFSYIVEFSPSMVREFIVQETQNQDDVGLNFVICIYWHVLVTKIWFHLLIIGLFLYATVQNIYRCDWGCPPLFFLISWKSVHTCHMKH